VHRDVTRRRGAVLRRLLREKGLAFRRAHLGARVEIVVESVADAGAAAGDGAPRWLARGTSERFLPVRVTGRGAPPAVASRLALRVTAADDEGLVGEGSPPVLG